MYIIELSQGTEEQSKKDPSLNLKDTIDFKSLRPQDSLLDDPQFPVYPRGDKNYFNPYVFLVYTDMAIMFDVDK